MEQHTRSTILYGLSGTLSILTAGAFAYLLLIGLTIPTVTEDFTNKLLFYSLIMVAAAWIAMNGFVSIAIKQFTKARRQWKLRGYNDAD